MENWQYLDQKITQFQREQTAAGQETIRVLYDLQTCVKELTEKVDSVNINQQNCPARRREIQRARTRAALLAPLKTAAVASGKFVGYLVGFGTLIVLIVQIIDVIKTK